MISLLLAAGANLESRAADGNTALGGAVYFGQIDAVAALLDAGADINVPARFDETPLMQAVRGNHPELVRTLLARRADVNAAADRSGHTALLLAVDRGLLTTVEMLLAAGSDVRQRDDQGRDAIAAARALDDTRLITLLQNAMQTHRHN